MIIILNFEKQKTDMPVQRNFKNTITVQNE